MPSRGPQRRTRSSGRRHRSSRGCLVHWPSSFLSELKEGTLLRRAAVALDGRVGLGTLVTIALDLARLVPLTVQPKPERSATR